MIKNTKRVDELEVGDTVNPPYDKSVLTIKSVRRLAEKAYQIGYQELDDLWSYGSSEEFTYLGNNKEEKIMNDTNINKINSRLEALEKLCNDLHSELFDLNFKKHMEAKVDCSALHPYFDLLVSDEVRLKGSTNIPVYVRQQLKNIHELFEDVLGLTLKEVKTLYFERKMGKQESTKTKKVYELLSGDVVVEPNCSNWKIVSKIEIANKDSGVYRVFYETDSPPNLGTYKHTDTFTYLHNVSNLENKKVDSEFITKKAEELCIADKIVLSGPVRIVEIVELKAIGDSHIQFTWEDSYSIYLKNTLVEVLKE